MAGVPIDSIKLHANWSLNNSTFEDYYYKPGDQPFRCAMIVCMTQKRYQEDNHIWDRIRDNGNCGKYDP